MSAWRGDTVEGDVAATIAIWKRDKKLTPRTQWKQITGTGRQRVSWRHVEDLMVALERSWEWPAGLRRYAQLRLAA